MAKSKGRLLAELLASDGKVKESKSALDISGGKLSPSDIPTLPNSKLENSSITIAGESTSLGGSVSLNTGHITEHTNYKYYTDGRVRGAISASGDISYNSTTGVISFSATDAPVISVNGSTGSVVLDTGDIAEGSNEYFTTARARASISATGSLAYNSTTGVMSFTMPAQNTSNITEGTNKYYTDARVGSYLSTNGYATQSTIVGAITDSAPATLDTLNELAAALGDDANFSTTVTNSIATKLPLAGGTMTGAINMGSNNISAINNATAVSFLSTNGYWVGGTQRINGSGNLVNIGTISSGAITTAGTFTGQNINLRNDVTGDGSTIRDISFLTSAAQGTDDRVALIRASNQAGDGSNRGGKLTFFTRQSGNANFNSALILDKNGNATFSGTISSPTIHNTGVIYLGSTATANDQFAVNNGTDIFIGTSAKGLRTYKDLHTNSGNNKYWHAGNDGSGSGLDADTVDGVQASQIIYGNSGAGTSEGTFTDWNSINKSGFYSDDGASNKWSTANWSSVLHHRLYSSNNNYATQLGFDTYNNNLYTRTNNNGTWTSWDKIWHAGVDGSGSGLDADLLDGQHGSYYQNATNITSGTLNNARLTDLFKAGNEIPNAVNLNSYRTTGYYSQNSNAQAAAGSNYPADLAGILEVITDDTGNGLHTLQRYARYNNNDTFNRYYYNGTWTSWRKEWNSLNDGSGSGLDADLLDGQQLSYVMNYDNLSNKPTNIGNSDTVDGIHAASFLRSDTADTATGTITFSGAVNLQGNVAFSKPIENFNTFTANKIHSSTETNMLAGKGSKLRVTIDGVASTSVASGLTNLNYEDRAVKGYQNDPDKVINIDLVTNGLYGSNGITYAAGFVVLNFYSSPFPSGYSSRVKNKDGTWTAMTLTKVGTTLRGTIPIGNYITDLEFTLSSGTTGPFVTGTEVWGLSDIAYYGNRMALSQGPNITSIGGYIDGNLTFGKTSGAPFTVNSSTVVTNLNADTVDGYHVGNSSNNTANRLVVTEGNGYISSNYFYTSSNNNGTTAISRIYASQDGYIRYYTPANFGAQISSHINYNSLQNKPSIPSLSGYATESYVGTQISNLVDSSPAALNTLNELAAAIGDDANFSTTVTNNIATKLPLAGGTLTGTLNVSATTNARDVKISAGYHLQRSDHHSGHLEGSYNNIGGNGAKSNPIYTIGSSYNPTDATLGNMYGIGYTDSAASFISGTAFSGWGMYVAADGDARVFLSGQYGTVASTGQHYVGSSVVWNAGNDGSGSGLDADLLDGMNATDSRAGNTIVKRQANGYMQAVYVNTTDDASSSNLGWLYGQRSNSDGYHRRFTAASIKTWGGFWASDNDGSGSGLDADLLDGQHGSHYLAWANVTGKPTIPTNNNQLTNGAGYQTAAQVTASSIAKNANTQTGSSFKMGFHSGSGGTTFGASHYSMGVDIANGGWSGTNYSDLIIGYHTGIRIGAGYSGIRFYNNSPTTDTNNTGNGNGGESLLMTIGGGGTTTSGANVTINNGLTVGGVIDANGGHGGINITNTSILSDRTSTWTGNPGANGKIQYHSARWYIVSDSSSDRIVQFRRDGADKSYINNDGALIGGGNWYSGNDGSGSGLDADTVDGIQGASFLRSDAADTFTGTIAMATQKALVANDYGHGVYGVYSSTKHQHVWSMGTSYNLASNGASVGNLYGLSWTHTNVGTGYGSNAAAGLGHQLNGRVNGNLQWALGDGIWSSVTGNVWGASNDGSGSGLDADTVDGLQASSFLRLDSGSATPQAVPANKIKRFNSQAAIDTASGSQGSLEVYGNNGAGTDAFMTFHVENDYALYFGLDGGTNKLSVGGWSAGAASHEIYHAGNKPSLATLGFTGASNANYITNNNQLTNGAGYITASGNAATSHAVTGSAFATTGSPGSVLEYQQAASQTDTKLAPSGDWHNSIRMGHGNPYSYYSNTIAIRMTGSGPGDLYTQTIAGGNVSAAWSKHWSARNDGAGSGLDADLLDGQQGSYYAPASSIPTVPSTLPNGSNLNASYGVTAAAGNGLKFWNGSDSYKVSMGNSAEYHYGPVTDYSIKTTIDSNASTRGFTWGTNGATPIAALNVGNGNMQIVGSFTAGGTVTATGGNSTNWNTAYTVANAAAPKAGATFTGQVNVDYASPKFIVGSTSNLDTSDANRPNITLNGGMYPHMTIDSRVDGSGNASTNTNHGPVFSFVSRLGASGYRRWAMGTAAYNAGALSWGYADNNANPHYGMGGNAGYTTTGSKMWLATTGALSTTSQGNLWGASNDGSGSGLDADLLDGQQGSYYYAASNPSGYINASGSAGSVSGITSNRIVYGGTARKSTQVSTFAGVNEVTGFYFGSGVTGAPTTDWINYMHSAGNSWSSSNNYSFQLTHAFHSDNLWVSRTTNGSQSTARKIWDSGNDGSGSTLDADTLDGVEGANFLRSNVADTINSGIVITQKGRFSTGTSNQNTNAGSFAYDWGFQESGTWTSPFPDLVIGYHTGLQMGAHKSYNGTRFFNDHPKHGSPTMIFSIGNGDDHIRATSNIYAYTSDKRLKENFRTIENAVDKVKSLGGYIFDWREDMMTKYEFEPDQIKDDAGVIAQDVLKVMPAAVQRAPFDYDPNKEGHSKSGKEFMTVQYEKMVPLLIQAIKEQQDQIDEQKDEINELKKLLENL